MIDRDWPDDREANEAFALSLSEAAATLEAGSSTGRIGMKEQVWLEVIDPRSGRKVDVVVSMHCTNWLGLSVDEQTKMDRRDLRASKQRILDALRDTGFQLSDIEYQEVS